MNYVLSNGTTFIMRKRNGKLVQTYDMNAATIYNNESKAWDVLSSLPSSYRGQGYLPKRIKQEEQQNDSETKKQQSEPQQPTLPVKRSEEEVPIGIPVPEGAVVYSVNDSDWLVELKKNLKITDQTMGSFKDTYSKLYQDLTDASNEIIDIEHAIEFQAANAVKKCYLESELKKALKKRRESKDAMALLDLVMKFSSEDWGRGKLDEELNRLNTRSYLPRCRPDLFE